MRTKHTTENAGGASAAEKIDAIRDMMDDLQFELYKLNCMAIVAKDKTDDALFTQRDINDRPGSYYVGDDDRKVIGYASSEIAFKSSELEDVAEKLVDDLFAVREMLKQPQPEPKQGVARSAALEDVIADWERSYAAWIATEKDGSIPNETPESEAEKLALAALVSAPCVTLGDVRRKASLFLSREYLRNSAPDFTDELMLSYASAVVS